MGGLGSAAGVWCGHRAHHQLAKHWEKGAGLATAGIVLGWLGIAVTVVVGVVLVTTPEVLGERIDQVERIARDFFDGRSALG